MSFLSSFGFGNCVANTYRFGTLKMAKRILPLLIVSISEPTKTRLE
jgi:hypothetical protein